MCLSAWGQCRSAGVCEKTREKAAHSTMANPCAGDAEQQDDNLSAYDIAGAVPGTCCISYLKLVRHHERWSTTCFEPLRKKRALTENGHAIDCTMHLNFRDVKVGKKNFLVSMELTVSSTYFIALQTYFSPCLSAYLCQVEFGKQQRLLHENCSLTRTVFLVFFGKVERCRQTASVIHLSFIITAGIYWVLSMCQVLS